MVSTPISVPAISAKIREMRLRQGYSIEQLAGISGINRGSLGRFELGNQKLEPEQIQTLLSIFGAHIELVAPASFAFEEKAEPVGS